MRLRTWLVAMLVGAMTLAGGTALTLEETAPMAALARARRGSGPGGSPRDRPPTAASSGA